jgi:tetratricopeptide (TPR) repeat protein
MILPELGGRVQMAYDKIRQRHFIYYNQVIKPALVGLLGPWISGGIEFNWPQHHRPSTFMPVDCKIEEHKDGSVTVWVNERERMFHQQGQAGFTLRPGHAFLEIQGRLYNPTSTPQTFLWWANPAVAVNDEYQSVFPPDVNAVFDHGKRAVSSFPIATGTYYKMDYSAGVDISNYKNIFVPTSYMVAKSKYNFEGGYENDSKAGMLHVADHHFSPGKKQWTWGNGDFGRAWDRALTDEDGPYIELMAGVYTENQPDFSWLMPYEEKTFVQYFMPYRELDIVKNASKDFILNVEQGGFKIFATSKQNVQIVLKEKATGRVLYDTFAILSPENVFSEAINSLDPSQVTLDIVKNGRTVLNYTPEPDEITPIPDAAEAALLPEEIKTNEQLYLTGLHLEQYRHATWSALDYYEEALRRDPLDVRCNNAIGLWFIRRGRYDKAENYLRTAVKVLQKRNPNPYDGEPLYNLALCLKYMAALHNDNAILDEAYDWAYKSTWNAAWQQAGYMMCAQIASIRGDFEEALYLIDKSLISGWHNHKARALKMAILCRLGHEEEKIKKFAEESLTINPFNYSILFEQGRTEEMKRLMHRDSNNYEELALDYAEVGLKEQAVDILDMAIAEGATTAMTYYYKAWLTGKEADHATAQAQPQDFCFPNRAEAVIALSQYPDDPRACYYLGNLYYDRRQYDLAQTLWEKSAQLEPGFPTVHRNLALVYFNKCHLVDRAIAEMEKAYQLDETDARILMELDQLYKRIQRPHEFRLKLLQSHPCEVAQRDDLVLEEISLLNQLGHYEYAIKKLSSHFFHVWEGGEGKVSGQYQIARVELAKQLLCKGSKENIERAVVLLNECLIFPHNLGEGKLYGAQDNDFYYFLGKAYTKLVEISEDKTERQHYQQLSVQSYQAGIAGPTEPAAAMYYNDAKPDKIFYAALCYRALGNEKAARGLFHKLISYGEKHLFDHITMDYFAVSLPDLLVWDGDLDLSNRIHCNYMLALGYYGLEDHRKGDSFLQKVLKLDINHFGTQALNSFINLIGSSHP